MKRTQFVVILAGVVAACTVPLAAMAAPAVGAVAGAVRWGKAIEVPGLARLSAGHGGTLVALSCSLPGDCAATGNYADRHGHMQAYVVSEKNGTWGNAIEVPRLAALNTRDDAEVSSLSCGSAGNCVAGGFYASSRGSRTFVVSEKNGTWGKAMQLPGSAGLAPSGSVQVSALSCASAGNCAAGGSYFSDGDQQAFVASEKNGTWGNAIEVPGSAALNTAMSGGVDALSCASAGNCAVTGSYRAIAPEAFVVNETNGSWGTAIEVPGAAAFGTATFTSVSCASAGNCAASGYSGSPTTDASFAPLVVSEKNGTWGNAISVPGTTSAARSAAETVSCASAGNCVTGGNTAPVIETPYQPFVASERNGSWRTAIDVPGSAALNADGDAGVLSVSCRPGRNCAAGGYYRDSAGHQQAFVVSENSGSWGTAIEVPGSGALNTGGSDQVMSVSCTSAGYCAAGGSYTTSSGNNGAFVLSRT
jgi:hypothetical protein